MQHTPDGGLTWNACYSPTRSLIKALRAVPVDGDFSYRIVRRRMGGRFSVVWTNQKTSEKRFTYPLY